MRQPLWLIVLFAIALPVLADDPAPAPKPLQLPEGVKIEQLADPKEAARVAEILEKEYPAPQSEATKMLIAILKGSQLDGSDGWFGPAQSRYSFAWLAGRSKGGEKAESIDKDQFAGSAQQFEALDRDGDE